MTIALDVQISTLSNKKPERNPTASTEHNNYLVAAPKIKEIYEIHEKDSK